MGNELVEAKYHDTKTDVLTMTLKQVCLDLVSSSLVAVYSAACV